MWGCTFAFMLGFSTIAVFGPTVKKMKAMGKFAKQMLVACPALTGSFFRIFLGSSCSKNGGKWYGGMLLWVVLAGMFWNLVFIFLVEPETVEDWSLKYFLWCLGGLMAGCGIAIFSLIVNVFFWS